MARPCANGPNGPGNGVRAGALLRWRRVDRIACPASTPRMPGRVEDLPDIGRCHRFAIRRPWQPRRRIARPSIRRSVRSLPIPAAGWRSGLDSQGLASAQTHIDPEPSVTVGRFAALKPDPSTSRSAWPGSAQNASGSLLETPVVLFRNVKSQPSSAWSTFSRKSLP